MTSSAPKILVVDDDAGLLRLMGKALQREGFQATTARSEAEMIRRLGEGPYLLLMIDLRLEETTGPELLERLRNRGVSVPFVVITGQGDERVAVEMMKKGALDYLVKDSDFLESMPMRIRRAAENLQQKQRLFDAENALKREHAFVSAILNTAGALVIVLDAKGRIIRFNPAAETVTGFSFRELANAPFLEVLVPDEDNAGSREVHDRIRKGERHVQRQGQLRTKQGDVRLIAWSCTLIAGETADRTYIIQTGIDITERRRLEEQVLEVSGREQRRIGQDLHDGLGQHLTGIELMTQCLEQALAAKKRPEAGQAARISKYVREAIRQSKALARGLYPVELDRHGLMSALQELANATAELPGVTCHFECPAPIQIDNNQVATQLYRIAQEAVNNAVKHARARNITISLLRETDRQALLRIVDNGAGFSPNPESTGMGLAIMKHRASVIGGSLDITSAKGSGTEVRCAFQFSHEKA